LAPPVIQPYRTSPRCIFCMLACVRFCGSTPLPQARCPAPVQAPYSLVHMKSPPELRSCRTATFGTTQSVTGKTLTRFALNGGFWMTVGSRQQRKRGVSAYCITRPNALLIKRFHSALLHRLSTVQWPKLRSAGVAHLLLPPLAELRGQSFMGL
jgi:hypothetical protein